MKKKFVGRAEGLIKLEQAGKRHSCALVAMKGRRRIGKSRLAAEYAKNKRFLSFTGLPPIEGVTAQDERDTFASQLAQNFKIPPLTFADWNDALLHLSHNIAKEKTVILFDEISWMASKDSTFLPKLKAWWDLLAQDHNNVMLILCGSVSTWIEENIINSTGFFGRISLIIDLEPLSLPECKEFLDTSGVKCSAYDMFKILSLTGGVPWYLEQISPNETADSNIKRLCFEKDGMLVSEFDRIFHDLFSGRGTIYRKVTKLLGQGMKTLAEIREELDYAHSGTLSDVLANLITSGFVTKHYQWSITSGKQARQSLYRLSDCYLRFYVKYIEPNINKIRQGSYRDLDLSALPGWNSMMGFQVETLLLQNRPALYKELGIAPSDLVADNPYLQREKVRQKGCQIDYLIQTRTKNLFVCEFKFKQREIGLDIIDELKEKIDRFSVPRGFGVIPVLFHLGGVSEALEEAGYFYRIIDIADFLRYK